MVRAAMTRSPFRQEDSFEKKRCQHTGVRYEWSRTHETCASCGKKVRIPTRWDRRMKILGRLRRGDLTVKEAAILLDEIDKEEAR